MNKKLGRYQQKVRLGLVPFMYDRNSKQFAQGAWKNQPADMLTKLLRAAGGRGD